MAFYSLVIYAGDGSNRNFTIHFPYLDKSHVKAKIDNATTTAFSWLTDSAIQFNTTPAAGASIEIYRETPLNASPVDFTDGSILLERDLDLLTTFNLYVDQELADRASRAPSAGNQAGDSGAGGQAGNSGAVKVSNTDTSLGTLNDKLTVVAPLSKTMKNGGGNEQLELSIDLSNYVTKGESTGGTGTGDMSGYATLKANTFDGVQTMTGLKVKDSSGTGSALITLQSSNDKSRDAQCGVQYLSQTGSVNYKHYYTSEKVAWHVIMDTDSTYRWCFGSPLDVATGASLSRANIPGQANLNYYNFNVGDPYNQSFGAATNIYGVSPRWPKLSMFVSNIFRGGFYATNDELIHIAQTRHLLQNGNGDTFFSIDKVRAALTYSKDRNNLFLFQDDGNIALVRNNAVVWSVNGSLTSDVRLKTDIKPLEGSSLEKVKQLSAKTYLWKDDLMGKGDTREIGLIAQDVANVLPEVVSKMSADGDTLGIAYMQLIPVLVEAVKELSAKVETLEAQLLQTKE